MTDSQARMQRIATIAAGLIINLGDDLPELGNAMLGPILDNVVATAELVDRKIVEDEEAWLEEPDVEIPL